MPATGTSTQLALPKAQQSCKNGSSNACNRHFSNQLSSSSGCCAPGLLAAECFCPSQLAHALGCQYKQLRILLTIFTQPAMAVHASKVVYVPQTKQQDVSRLLLCSMYAAGCRACAADTESSSVSFVATAWYLRQAERIVCGLCKAQPHRTTSSNHTQMQQESRSVCDGAAAATWSCNMQKVPLQASKQASK